jgi:hypothetical protein
MTIWYKTIQIKELLRDKTPEETEYEHISSISKSIHRRLEPYLIQYGTLRPILDRLTNNLVDTESLMKTSCVLEAPPEELFNRELDRLYDWADRNSVWLE